MFCRISRKMCYLAWASPFNVMFSNDSDKVEDSKTLEAIRKSNEDQTGWDRLKMMYSADEFGGLSPEITNVLHAGCFGVFFGACYGGFISSRIAYINFMDRNDATAFRSHLDAKKKLQDQVTIGFAKGAWRWGWRLGLFTSSYVLVSTTIAMYRGHSSIVEYVAAGAVTGACYKINMGLRGMAVGGGLGSVLGAIAGVFTVALLRLTGMTMEDIHLWQHDWMRKRKTAFLSGGGSKEPNVLLDLHDKQLKESGKHVEVKEIRSQ